MLLDDAIQKLLLETHSVGRSDETVNFYRKRLEPLLSFLGNVEVKSITKTDLQRFVAHLLERETLWPDHPIRPAKQDRLKTETIRGYIRAIKRLFSYLEEESVIMINPSRKLSYKSVRRKEPKAISQEDFLALLQTTATQQPIDWRDQAIFVLLADTGCRIGGLTHLKVGDIMWEQEQGLLRLTEKGDNTRWVPFLPITGMVLKRWLEVRPQDQGDWLFVGLGNKDTGRICENGVRQMIRRRAEEAGISGRVNPHAFRHAFARDYLLNGGDLATVSELMGHSGLDVTKDNYAIFNVRELQAKHALYSPVARLQTLPQFRAILGG